MEIDKLIDRINQLIDITSELLFYSKELKNLHDTNLPKDPFLAAKYKSSEISLMLRLLHCTFFYDVLLNLNTLLAKLQTDPNKKEQSFFELSEIITEEIKKEKVRERVKTLRATLESENLHKWRHKFAGHKDIEVAGDTTIMYMNFIKPEYISISENLLSEMKNICIEYFDVTANNPFKQLYTKSFNKMLELFANDLKISKKI